MNLQHWLLVFWAMLIAPLAAQEQEAEPLAQPYLHWTGRQLMEEVYNRHEQFPYIYEEQSLIMMDRHGERDTRKARRYTRVEENGTVNFLLLFDAPEQIRGVAVLAVRDQDGTYRKSVYMPALGEDLVESAGELGSGNFLGTDFTVESITGESLDNYHYRRQPDREIDGQQYFITDVLKNNTAGESVLRRHFISVDNFYITRTDHLDPRGRLRKTQSHHDLKAVDGKMWRADMILMEDRLQQHRSLIKINRRVFSHDYVPAEMFSAEWLRDHFPSIANNNNPEPSGE